MFFQTNDQTQPIETCRASQQRLLDTARGLLLVEGSSSSLLSHSRRNGGANGSLTALEKDEQLHMLARGRGRRCMRSFPLTERNLRPEIKTPEDFHAVLCGRIRNAQDRVYLATLYIGAGGDGKVKEEEFLAALSDCPAPDVRILMDQSRALRPIEVRRSSIRDTLETTTVNTTTTTRATTTTTMTDSAKACRDALRARDHERADVYLFQILSPWQQWCLPNPLDEIFGVFHIKCYVIDNDIILTGANLSEEYFSDRADRYLWLTSADENNDDDDSLVNCYADMVKALCQGAERYQATPADASDRISRGELLASLTSILTEDEDDGSADTAFCDKNAIAYAVPTFQAPSQFFDGYSSSIPNDVDIIQSLTRVATADLKCQMRVASAYLNPTDSFQSTLTSAPFCALLTAGPLSHGFKPKTAKDGTNKGVPWIPNAYYTMLEQQSNNARCCWFYQREGWTFHAKGVWFSDPGKEVFRLGGAARIRAATHGSGNYGHRSADRDMESNLVLIMAPGGSSTLEDRLRNEWNRYEDYSVTTMPRQPTLPLWVKWALPYIRRFL